MATPDTTTQHSTTGAAANGQPLIRFEDVVKRFGQLTVLDQLNFSVNAGERVTLIGPSGSGKTTILRLLMTLEDLTGGHIWVGDQPLWHMRKGDKLVPANQKHLREVRKQIGMVFQHFNLFPNMTVLQNLIEAPIRVLGKSRGEASEKARELLDQVGLGEKVDAHPSQLSGGQQQRVAVARALVGEPKLILADEPTGNLDTAHGEEVMRMLRQLNQEGSTIVMVTHSPAHADFASRVVNMLDGRILQERRRAA